MGRCVGGLLKDSADLHRSQLHWRETDLRGQEAASDQPFVFCVFQSDILWNKSTKTMRSEKTSPVTSQPKVYCN